MSGDHSNAVNFRQLATPIAVGVTVAAAFFSSIQVDKAQEQSDKNTTASKALDKKADALDAKIDCQLDLLKDGFTALKARSTFNESTAEIQKVQNKRTIAFLDAISVPGADGAAELANYKQALQTANQSIDERFEVGDLNPYPTDAAIKACG